jgi:beta-galactosidase
LKIEESVSSIRVSYPEGSYEFDRASGRLVSAAFRGTELLQEGPRANVWRAPLCNETDQWGRRPADQWYRLQLDSLKEAAVSVRAESQPGEVHLRVSTRSTPPEGDTAFGNEYFYRLFPSGDIVLELEVKPSGTQPRWLPKVGLQMVLPEAFSQFSWYGRGPFETYPDRKTGAKVGIYSGSVDEQYEPHLAPQDYGNKTDVRWVALTNGDRGLLVAGKEWLNVSAQVHDTVALSRALYPPQLRADSDVTLNLDHRVTGVGETPNKTHPKYRVLPAAYDYSVWLEPLRKGEPIAQAGRALRLRLD